MAQVTQQLLSFGSHGPQAVVGHGGSLWPRAVHAQLLRSHRDLRGAEQGHTVRGDVHADKQRCGHRDTGTCGVLHWDVDAGTGGCASQVHPSNVRTGTSTVLCRVYRDVRGAAPGRARPHPGTCSPGPLWDWLLLAPRVPVPPGGAGRGAAPGGGFPLADGAVSGAE